MSSPSLYHHDQSKKKRVQWSRIKRRLFKHVWFLRGGLVLLIGLAVFLGLLLLNRLAEPTDRWVYLRAIKHFVFTPENAIKSVNDRTTLIVLGKGGEGHEAPDLTDTIMAVSFSHTFGKYQIDVISLPRDIWIPELRAKLNSVYYWGNRKTPGGGLVLAKSVVEEIIGIPVQYVVVIDFEGFLRVVDVVGGIDVEVERGFVDEKYPIAGREDDDCEGDPEFGCRYETVEFEKGTTHMDATTALKFIRSRNAEGDEGTDLARAVRQERVIEAIKAKILGKKVLLSPKKLSELLRVIQGSNETDVDANAFAVLARRVLQSRDTLYTHVLPEDLLKVPQKSPQYDNLYVFIPTGGDWQEVHQWIKSIINR